jgi:hypothetical protein
MVVHGVFRFDELVLGDDAFVARAFFARPSPLPDSFVLDEGPLADAVLRFRLAVVVGVASLFDAISTARIRLNKASPVALHAFKLLPWFSSGVSSDSDDDDADADDAVGDADTHDMLLNITAASIIESSSSLMFILRALLCLECCCFRG